jgi:hypothetical protein
MEQIPVGRWLFWAGVLMLVATIVLSAVYGQQSNPPYGTGWDFLPVLVILALILLLVGVGFANPLDSDVPDEPADTSAGTR